MVFPPSWDELERRLRDRRTDDEAAIARHAFARAPSLLQSARDLVLDGATTPEEAARVTRASDSGEDGAWPSTGSG